MKILTTIKSTDRAMQFAHTTFRWAARAGFDIRVFVPAAEVKAYQDGVDDANYHYYLVGRDETDIVVADQEPLAYAAANGYDLIVELPDNLLDYKTVEDDDKSFVEFATDAGAARREFSLKPDLEELQLEGDCVMKRVPNGKR